MKCNLNLCNEINENEQFFTKRKKFSLKKRWFQKFYISYSFPSFKKNPLPD